MTVKINSKVETMANISIIIAAAAAIIAHLVVHRN
jgi:hypothetical protein